jgi:hypothetical protein
VEGKVRVHSTTQQRSITQLATTVFPSKIIYFLKWILPFISMVTVGLNTFDVIPNSIMIGILLSVLLVIFYFYKASNKAIYPVQNLDNEVNAMISQLHLLKKLQPSSELTQSFIAELMAENGVEQELKKLALIQKRISYRANFLVSVVLNLFAAWDFLDFSLPDPLDFEEFLRLFGYFWFFISEKLLSPPNEAFDPISSEFFLPFKLIGD